MDDAVDAAFLSGDDGDDVAVFANGDEIFLQRAVAAVGAQEMFERFLNALSAGVRYRGGCGRARRWRHRQASHREEKLAA